MEPGIKHKHGRPRLGPSWTVIAAVAITAVFVLYGIIYYVMNSEPYTRAESFVRQNQTIRAEIGEVDKSDPWFPIEIYPFGPEGNALFTFDVIGKSKQTIEVSVHLQKRENRWRIISASYKDREGVTKHLLEGI